MMRPLNFRNESPGEIQLYYPWFVSTVTERLKNFEKLFHSTGGEGALGFTRNSFVPLVGWLKQNVQFRTRSASEIERYRHLTPKWFFDTLKQPILTDLYWHRSGDFGTYIGEVFIRDFPSLRWTLSAGGYKNANFGQPVLRMSSGMEIPPLKIASSIMNGLLKLPDPCKRLITAYEYWEALLNRADHHNSMQIPPII